MSIKREIINLHFLKDIKVAPDTLFYLCLIMPDKKSLNSCDALTYCREHRNNTSSDLNIDQLNQFKQWFDNKKIPRTLYYMGSCFYYFQIRY
jgi:NRPS condensation-like uncharacterized protein